VIPRADITAWRAQVPWISDAQVEQDLLICRALVEIFSVAPLAEKLAFRGGTAIHRLFILPAARYSEDIDLVQIGPGPIGEILDGLHDVLDPVLGAPKREAAEGGVRLVYRMESEIPPVVRLRLKIEINTREHFTLFGLEKRRLAIRSDWHTGEADLTTYALEELLGTKLRALYQRRKGRDLFDLWLGLTQGGANPERVVHAFRRYLSSQGQVVSQKEFRQNLSAKMANRSFLGDLSGLIRPDVAYDAEMACEEVESKLLTLL
jgi:predicted nucleotidyltransferase component of viral defense system